MQRLWGASRRNNFEIHLLERKLLDSSEKLKELKSQAINVSTLFSSILFDVARSVFAELAWA